MGVIETLITDLLSMIFLPEWPVAPFLLARLAAAFLKLLEDGQTTDVRGAAVEHLGSIAAVLRATEVELAAAGFPQSRFTPSWAPDRVKAVVDGYELTIKSLQETRFKGEAHVVDCTINFWRARALSELGHMQRILFEVPFDLDVPVSSRALSEEIERGCRRITEGKRLSDVTRPSNSSSFVASDEGLRGVGITVKMLTLLSPTFVTFDVIKHGLLRAMDDKSIPTRQRAIRMMYGIYTVDTSLLDDGLIRSAVDARLVDGSPAVREQALKLLADFLVRAPDHVPSYIDAFLSRLSDNAVSVRKRVVKSITRLYTIIPQSDLVTRLKLCLRLVRAVVYDTTGLQPLALDALGEMWLGIPMFDTATASTSAGASRLPPVHTTPSVRHDNSNDSIEVRFVNPHLDADNSSELFGPCANQFDGELVKHASIVVLVARRLRERPCPLAETFKAFRRHTTRANVGRLESKFRCLVDQLVNTLDLTHSAATDTACNVGDTADHLKAIHAVVSAYPMALSVAKAKDLLPLLTAGNAKSPNELVRLETTLRIFSASIPHLPRTSVALNEQLQKVLTGLVNRPPPVSPASPVIEELIACFCAACIHLSHDHKILVRTLLACLSRMRSVVTRMTAAPPAPSADAPPVPASARAEQLGLADRAKALVIAMTSLLCEHADFDKLREEHTDLAPLFDKMGGASVLATVYGLLLRLHRSPLPAWKLAALQSMGQLLRTYPSLWTQSQTEAVMDQIFADDNLRQKEYLIRIMAEYLGKEHRRQADANDAQRGADSAVDARGKVDMAQLVGNAETFAESSISTQLIQRYLDPVLEAAAMVESPLLQRFAMDVLDHTVKRGLSHPLHCVVTLIAVETSSDRRLASKALELHTILASKHGSIIAVRYLENARAAFDYQRKVHPVGETLRGHEVKAAGGGGFVADRDACALLAPWYGLLSEKRARLDLVRTLTKTMDYDATMEADVDVNSNNGEAMTATDVLFARFAADNLAVLPYRSMDELLTVLHELKTIISTTGMQALHVAQREALPTDTDEDSGLSTTLTTRHEFGEQLESVCSRQTVSSCFALADCALA